MTRSLLLILALAVSIAPFAGAFADDAKEDKAAVVAGEKAAPPKIRVILPASWEPAIPQPSSQAASSQRSAAR